jgi:radical SAM PhpK family P-methyltransferase
MPIDCLIIGYNDSDLPHEVSTLQAMGKEHPNYRDLNLNIIQHQGIPYRAMDIFDHFHSEGRPRTKKATGVDRVWHQADVLWMVIMYLGTYLQRRGFSFDYINLFQLQQEELRHKLLTNQYRVIVITTTIYNYDAPIIEVVRFVRELTRGPKIIIGGPYIAKRSETMEEHDLKAMFKYIGGDFYVRSREGEQALVNILTALKEGRELANIPNIAFRQDDDFILTRTEREINLLYENLIDYSLFPPEHIGGYVNVRVTKGCPFTCAFCSFPLRTEKYNVSKLEYILRELDAIRDVGTVTGIFFIDDTLNVPLGTFKDMMRMMIERNYGFKWHCFFRADFCDAELVDLMAQAGCQGVFLGLESANDQILANMNKTPRKKHYLSVVPMFKNAGIQVFASLFFGFPGETYDTAMETMEFLDLTKPDFYRPLVWYCDPVTPIWAEKEKYGIKGYHFSWAHNTMDVATACHLVERCFTTFDTPLWVPDPGFNFVSLFLLQNRGLSLNQVKTFLRCFNNVVKEKLIYPDRPEPSPELIDNLRRACQFDRPPQVKQEILDIFSAEEYKRAETFWFKELGAGPRETRHAGERSLSADGWRLDTAHETDNILIDSLGQACCISKTGVLLTAYALGLWLVEGLTVSTIVLADDEYSAFPIQITVHSGITFRQLAQIVETKIASGRQHRLFAACVILNMLRMPASVMPHFHCDAAYLETPSPPGLDDRHHFSSSVYQELNLVLAASTRCDSVEMQFMHNPAHRNKDVVARLGKALTSILTAAAENPNVQPEQIIYGEPEKQSSGVLVLEEAPEFIF